MFAILDSGAEFFNVPNPSSHNTGLGFTEPLTEVSTRNLRFGKVWQTLKAHNLTAIC
jgi:hypothetical protein